MTKLPSAVADEPDSTRPPLLRLTMGDLRDGIRTASAGAASKHQAAWSLLVDLADELADVVNDDILIGDRRWTLSRVEVTGFRGITQRFDLRLLSSIGLTVIHGDNGAGKSSIAEAVRMALEGRAGQTHLGTSSKPHLLWGTSDNRSTGADVATVTVTLADFSDPQVTLRVTARLNDDGVDRSAELRHADGTVETISSESPSWNSWDAALRTAPPVFAYAEMADELRRREDLTSWLSACLAMDAASRQFNAAVEDCRSSALSAQRTLATSRTQTAAAVELVDRLATEQGVTGITPIPWSALSDDDEIGPWLVSHGVDARTRLDIVLSRDLLDSVTEYTEEHRNLSVAWSTTATALLKPQVVSLISELGSAVVASGQEANNDRCPVCGSHEPAWRAHLHAASTGFSQAREAAKALKNHLRRLESALLNPLRQVMGSLPDDHEPQEVRTASDLIERAQMLYADSSELDAHLLQAVGDLAGWLQTSLAKQLITTAVAAADRRHGWMCDRWEAVQPLLEVWAAHHVEAATAERWKAALLRWNSHLATIRKERSSVLQNLVSPAVDALLGDVGIRLHVLDINKGGIKLELTNDLGQDVALSHLSAGQRNALILGPVIATVASGPFCFRIIDDPVHAFDDFRVDRLAATMAGLCDEQSLVLTTHDGRFVEYLRVHAPPAFDVLRLTRGLDGAITVMPSDAPWQVLVDHAERLHRDATTPAAAVQITTDGVANIRVLLRMCIDEALETAFLRHVGTLDPVARASRRPAFDQAMSLKDRRKAMLKGLSGQLHRDCAAAIDHAAPFFSAWSTSIHATSSVTGDPAKTLPTEIAAARRTCEQLDAIAWA